MQDNNDETLSFTVSYNKQPISIEHWSPSRTIGDLKNYLEEITSIPPDNQKILGGAKMLKNETTFQDANIQQGAKLMLIGSTKQEVKQVSDAFVEAAKREAISKTAPPVKATPSSARGIRTVESLSQEVQFASIRELAGWPNSDKAREILERLSKDTGIVGVMKRYNWRVGVLSEMSPLEVTKLGVNVNKGQEISLRLRFQEGFRHYDSIKEVLYHELAHMEISPHDASFKALNSKIRKEARELDTSKSGRTLSEGYSTESRFASSEENEILDEEVDQGGVGYKLGGGESDALKSVLTPREMAARAAMIRQAAIPTPEPTLTPSSSVATTLNNKSPPTSQPSKGDRTKSLKTNDTSTPSRQNNSAPTTTSRSAPTPATIPTPTTLPTPAHVAPNESIEKEASVCPICGFVFSIDTSNRGINLHLDQHF